MSAEPTPKGVAMPTSDHRLGNENKRRSAAFRDAIILELAELGVSDLHRTPEPKTLSEAFAPDAPLGNIQGLKDWTLRSYAQQRHDLSTASNTVRREAEDAGTPFAAAIVPRHAGSPGQAYVVLDLDTFARVLQLLPQTQADGSVAASPV